MVRRETPQNIEREVAQLLPLGHEPGIERGRAGHVNAGKKIPSVQVGGQAQGREVVVGLRGMEETPNVQVVRNGGVDGHGVSRDGQVLGQGPAQGAQLHAQIRPSVTLSGLTPQQLREGVARMNAACNSQVHQQGPAFHRPQVDRVGVDRNVASAEKLKRQMLNHGWFLISSHQTRRLDIRNADGPLGTVSSV